MNTLSIAAKLIPVVFQDDHYVFVSKPAGLYLSRPSRPGEPGCVELGPLVSEQPLYPVAPLAAHLSGIVPLAKSPDAAQTLTRVLEKAKASCEYTAVVTGSPGKAQPQPPPTGRRPKSPSVAILPQIIRRRGDQTMLSFSYTAGRSSELRAALQTAKFTLLGEPHRRPDPTIARARPRGRVFLHRSKILFRHPFTGRPVTVHAPLPPAFNVALTQSDRVEDFLEVALASRIPCLVDDRTDAFRLITGQVEGLPGLVAEKLGPVVLLQTHQGKFQGDIDAIRRVANWYHRTLGSQAVYHKRFTKAPGGSSDNHSELFDPTPLVGDPVPEEIPIRENGLTFLIHPYDGPSFGLFLDQRNNRRRIAQLAQGKRVLNAFAYTCGFSVAAANGPASGPANGAATTVSVDISVKALEWGKRNFAANGINLDDHLFIRSGVFDYFKRARRQARQFDLIVLDVPTFARSKKPARVFTIATDLVELLTEALSVLAPGGTMLLSTNSRTRSHRWLTEQVTAAAHQTDRRVHLIAKPRLPTDFEADRDHAKSQWLRFD